MSMNKKEQEMMEELKAKLELALAFRRTTPVKPDVPPPQGFNVLTDGWLPVGAKGTSARVEPACSSSTSHGIHRTDKTTSQNPRSLYSTKVLALRALRWAVEEDCAKRLLAIDRQIEMTAGDAKGESQ